MVGTTFFGRNGARNIPAPNILIVIMITRKIVTQTASSTFVVLQAYSVSVVTARRMRSDYQKCMSTAPALSSAGNTIIQLNPEAKRR